MDELSNMLLEVRPGEHPLQAFGSSRNARMTTERGTVKSPKKLLLHSSIVAHPNAIFEPNQPIRQRKWRR